MCMYRYKHMNEYYIYIYIERERHIYPSTITTSYWPGLASGEGGERANASAGGRAQ